MNNKRAIRVVYRGLGEGFIAFRVNSYQEKYNYKRPFVFHNPSQYSLRRLRRLAEYCECSAFVRPCGDVAFQEYYYFR